MSLDERSSLGGPTLGHAAVMDNAAEVQETCDECGFDANDWTRDRITKELGTAADAWREVFGRHEADTLHARPRPEVWSAVEYAVHTARVVEFWGDACRTVTSGGVVDIDMASYPDADVFPYNEVAPDEALADLATHFASLHGLTETASTEEWAAPLRISHPEIEQAFHAMGIADAGTGALHAVHDALHHLGDVERGLLPA